MLRKALALAVGIALVTALPMTASAGGWDSLPFDRDFYLVGSVATASDAFFVGAEEDGFGDLDAKVFHAYLLPLRVTESGFAMIHPPTIPRGSIDLGSPEVTGPIERGRYLYGRVSLAFRVPDVPSGTYAIGFCDVPCESGTIGWLAYGRIRIVHTPAEGRLMSQLDARQLELYRVEASLRKANRELARSDQAGTADTEGIPPGPGDATTPSERVVLRVRRIEDRGGVPIWALVAAVGSALVIGFGTGRIGRRRSVVVPDTVPDDLVVQVTSNRVRAD